MKKKLIVQKYDNDCGIASLAMLYGISYSKARKIILDIAASYNERFDGTPRKYARDLGAVLGRPIKVWFVSAKNKTNIYTKLMGRPAVLIVPALGYPPGTERHAVFWDGYELFDPNGPDRRTYPSNGQDALLLMDEVWVLG